MPFIKAQKVKRDESGRVVSGSASVVDTEYVAGAKYHSRQRVRERLGRVVELAEDGRSGVFQVPDEGAGALRRRLGLLRAGREGRRDARRRGLRVPGALGPRIR